jgi:hypothetical protein
MNDAVGHERQLGLDLDGLVADEDLTVGRDGDHRREDGRAGFRIGNHARSLTIHHGDEAIGGAEVYSENPCHVN